jgi:hypothetical protein
VTDDGLITQACTLPTAEQPMRVAEFGSLFAEHVVGMDRPAPTRLRLRLEGGPEVAARTRDLAARETECCSFFEFAVDDIGVDVVLDVAVPPSHASVLDGLAAVAGKDVP